MKTANLFLCKLCALPIRNKTYKVPKGSHQFVCDSCDVCSPDRQKQMDKLQRSLDLQLRRIITRLYRYKSGSDPSRELLGKINALLSERSNPADDALDAIGNVLKPSNSNDDLLRQVCESERILAGFFYLSQKRISHVNSKTVLRHWVALVELMRKEVETHDHSGTVWNTIANRPRYELGLPRLSRLIGDNPVVIIRDPAHYTARGRESKLLGMGPHDHIPALIRQTQKRNMDPSITARDLTQILRFAGNAAFVTEHDEVIEFRNATNDNLCKYLLRGEILMIIDDLWFLKNNDTATHKRIEDLPNAELITIYPKRLAADQLTNDLVKGRYLPNCIDLRELTRFLDLAQC